jgi:hypothetical protein
MLYIPFRFGRNGRKISYWHANWYEAPPCSTSAKISACFGLFRPVYVIRPKYFFGFLYIFFFSLLTYPALFLSSFFFFLLLLLPFSSFFFLLLSSTQLSLCLCTFSLPFFFLSFWFKCRDCREVLKAEMKKKKRQKKWTDYSGVLKAEMKKKKRQKKWTNYRDVEGN